MNKGDAGPRPGDPTDTDRGVIALLDDRFLKPDYQALFPREWETFAVVNRRNVRRESWRTSGPLFRGPKSSSINWRAAWDRAEDSRCRPPPSAAWEGSRPAPG